MDRLYYQPNHLWKGQKAVKKLRELSREKPKAVKQWLSRQVFWQVHLPALNPISAGGGGWNPPPPGFSLAIATKINRSTPNFLTFNFYYRDII